MTALALVAISCTENTTPDVSPRDASLVESELVQEQAAIAAPSSATLLKQHKSHGQRKALVTSYFSSTSSYTVIRSHYDEQLKAHGWSFQHEKPLRDWFRDLGGKTVRYSKGEYNFDLQWAGEKADYGWTFATDASWGLR